jgi:hypothetical protein
VLYPFAGHRSKPDIHWNYARHATVYHNGCIWEVREDEPCAWLIFVHELNEPVHRITSGGWPEALRWIAGRRRSWTGGRKGGNP